MRRIWQLMAPKGRIFLGGLAAALVVAAFSALALTHQQARTPVTSRLADGGTATSTWSPTPGAQPTDTVGTEAVPTQTAIVGAPQAATPTATTSAPEPTLDLWGPSSKQENVAQCPSTLSVAFFVRAGPSTPPPPVTVTFHWLRLDNGNPATLPTGAVSPAGEQSYTFNNFAEGPSLSEVWTLPASEYNNHTLSSQVVVTAINGQRLGQPIISAAAPISAFCPTG